MTERSDTSPPGTPDAGGARPSRETIGLVLGGGGARGLAHIVMLEAFDELGVKPDIIAGTSIGALFGAAYAYGISGAEMRTRAADVLANRREIARRLMAGPAPITGLLSLRPLSQALLTPERICRLVFPESDGLALDGAPIPLALAVTDYYAHAGVTLTGGVLVNAIAASMAIPALFRPVPIGGRVYVDGGLTNPLPIDAVAGRAAITVAIDVTGGPARQTPHALPRPMEMLLSAAQIMQNALVRDTLARCPPRVLVRPDVDAYRLLDFHRIADVLAAAEPAKDDLKRKLDAVLA